MTSPSLLEELEKLQAMSLLTSEYLPKESLDYSTQPSTPSSQSTESSLESLPHPTQEGVPPGSRLAQLDERLVQVLAELAKKKREPVSPPQSSKTPDFSPHVLPKIQASPKALIGPRRGARGTKILR
jgi:hypothetical protein